MRTILVLLLWTTAALAEQLSIPYVPTRQDVVKDLLWLANVGKDDVVYDLGSGDGRIVIEAVRDFGARGAVGIEIDPKLITASRELARKAGVADRVEFIEGDLFTNDFSGATVVALYLGHTPNLELRARLFRTLRPGVRVVAHQFGMGEWPPKKTLSVRTQYLGMFGMMFNPFADNPRVPDFGSNDDVSSTSTMRVWIVPAAVAGVWRGKLSTPDGEREMKLVLHQRIGEVTGSFELQSQTNLAGGVRVDLWGDHLRFDGYALGQSYSQFRLLFDGHITNDTLAGKLAVSQKDQAHEYPWVARREKLSFAGVWEWTVPPADRPVQLQIAHRKGRWQATYTDRGKSVAVEDFYNFGGGFYFTHMIGRENRSLRIDDDTGWLIGEAIPENGGLEGTIEFHPYPGGLGIGEKKPAGQPQPWKPRQKPER